MRNLLIAPDEIGRHTVATLLDPATKRYGDSLALIALDGRLTYDELDSVVNRAANALHSLGIQRGDRVAVSLPNGVAAAVSLFATARIGAIWVGLNRHLTGPEKAHMITDCGARAIVGDEPTLEQVLAGRSSMPDLQALVGPEGAPDGAWEALTAAASVERPDVVVAPSDVAVIAYTSGTTGRPKGAVHLHRSLLVPGSALAATRGFNASTRYGVATSLMNLMGAMLSTLTMPQVGGCVVVIDHAYAPLVAKWVHEEQITDLPAVAALVHDLATNPDIDPAHLRSLRDVVAGAGDISPDTVKRFEAATHVRLAVGYGQTEIPGTATVTPLGSIGTSGASGRALPHVEVATMDTDGVPVPPGQEGEICVRAARRGPWAGLHRSLIGYWNRPEEEAETVRGGYRRTGDLGILNLEGDLFVKGRRSAMIIRGGANVYPAEVERVLLADRAVGGVVVVGLPDERLGERVVALVEPLEGQSVDIERCDARCRAELASYKCPEALLVVASLPRNTLGKVVRPAAVQLATELLGARGASEISDGQRS